MSMTWHLESNVVASGVRDSPFFAAYSNTTTSAYFAVENSTLLSLFAELYLQCRLLYFSELTTYLLIQTDRSTPKDREKSVTFRVYPRMAQRERIRLDMAASSGRSPPFQACDQFKQRTSAYFTSHLCTIL